MKKVAIALLIVIMALAALFVFMKPDALRFLKGSFSKATGIDINQQSATSTQTAIPADNEPDPFEEADEAPVVEIDKSKQELIGLKTVEVKRIPLKKTIRTVGRIQYDERQLATVNTKVEGWIERLYVNYTGQYVKRGAPMAEIYSPELIATQKEFINLLNWAANIKEPPKDLTYGSEPFVQMLSTDNARIVAAARQRLKLWDMSDAQVARIEKTRQVIRSVTVYSPATGYVTNKYAIHGTKVMAGEKLFDIADLSSLWVMADIYEYELPFIKPGQTAYITLSYLPGKKYESIVDYIYPSLSGESRTVKVRLLLKQSGDELKPQMFANVSFDVNSGPLLAVPEDCVIDTGKRQIVYVEREDGHFEPRIVTIGIKTTGSDTGAMVEILTGVAEHEKVATGAAFLVDSESKLRGIEPLQDGKAPDKSQENNKVHDLKHGQESGPNPKTVD